MVVCKKNLLVIIQQYMCSALLVMWMASARLLECTGTTTAMALPARLHRWHSALLTHALAMPERWKALQVYLITNMTVLLTQP